MQTIGIVFLYVCVGIGFMDWLEEGFMLLTYFYSFRSIFGQGLSLGD